MRDYLSLGPTPYDEDCAQVGSDNYYPKARAESTRYIAQLRRMFGPEPEGAAYRIKSNPHDFGDYLDVEIGYDDQYPAAVEYAYHVEDNLPAQWDAEDHIVQEVRPFWERIGRKL